MRILVTGGAGFIGSHIVDSYLREGHEVAVIDDLSTGREKNVNSAASFYHLSIQSTDIDYIFRNFKPEVINHHAANIDLRRSVNEPLFDADINVMGTLNILQHAVRHGTGKIIFASTGGAIYGDPPEVPVNEDTVPKPLSPYGANKLVVEHYLRIWNNVHGLKYTILRYPNVYGPRQDPKGEAGVVAIFSLKILSGESPVIFGDGTKTRDYLYVQDVVKANVLSLKSGDNQIFNLGWGKEITDEDVFLNVKQAAKSDIDVLYDEIRPGEVDRIALDATLARTKLKWHPEVTFGEGTQKAFEYYRDGGLD